MRVAYLTTSFVPSVAANSVQVMKMAAAGAAVGHDVTLYAAYGPEDADPFAFYGVERGFELARAERPAGGRAGALRYLASQTARLWGAGPVDLYYGRAARLLLAAAPFGRPLRYEAHVLPSSTARRRIQAALFRLPNFDRLVCISGALADDYRAAFPGLDPAKVQVAHDGADPMPADVAPVANWPGREDALQVGYVGGIYPGRGVETLVEVAGRAPELDLHVIGGDAETVAWWRERSAPANVYFHGHVPHARLPSYYAHLDALTAPYRERVSVHGGTGDIRRWMSPLKVFEYMSTGLPIVCTDVPVLREVLRDGENALLLPSDDMDAWTAALRTLAADPALRDAFGGQARDEFHAEYTWYARAEHVLGPVPDTPR